MSVIRRRDPQYVMYSVYRNLLSKQNSPLFPFSTLYFAFVLSLLPPVL